MFRYPTSLLLHPIEHTNSRRVLSQEFTLICNKYISRKNFPHRASVQKWGHVSPPDCTSSQIVHLFIYHADVDVGVLHQPVGGKRKRHVVIFIFGRPTYTEIECVGFHVLKKLLFNRFFYNENPVLLFGSVWYFRICFGGVRNFSDFFGTVTLFVSHFNITID